LSPVNAANPTCESRAIRISRHLARSNIHAGSSSQRSVDLPPWSSAERCRLPSRPFHGHRRCIQPKDARERTSHSSPTSVLWALPRRVVKGKPSADADFGLAAVGLALHVDVLMLGASAPITPTAPKPRSTSVAVCCAFGKVPLQHGWCGRLLPVAASMAAHVCSNGI